MQSSKFPLTKSQRYHAYGPVFLDYPPMVNPRWVARDNAEITIGDLHANAKKLLYVLKAHQFFDISDQEYIKFCRIYNKPIDLFTRQDVVDLNTIIDNMPVNPNALNALLRIMGDEFADRGKCDYFVLKIIEKLVKCKVKIKILISNHGICFLKKMEHGAGSFDFNMSIEFTVSAHNLQRMFDVGLIVEDLDEIYLNSYLPYLKIIDYDGVMYTHAPSGRYFIWQLVEDINHYFEKKVVMYQDKTPEDLAGTIDGINKILIDLAKKFKLSDFCNRSKHKALDKIIWNRKYEEDILGRDQNDSYVNGHDLDEGKVVSDNDNVRCLDNRCGQGDIYSSYVAIDRLDPNDDYFILYKSDLKKPNIKGFYCESIEDLIASTKELLNNSGLKYIVIPGDKDYDFYNIMYNVIALLINDQLHQEVNITKTVSVLNSLKGNKLQSFYNALVQSRYSSGKLTQRDLDDLVKNNAQNLETILKSKYLHNLVKVLKPDITNAQMLHFDADQLDEVLRFCQKNKFINYGIYQCILSNLDKLDIMQSMEDFNVFKAYIYSLEIDEQYMLKNDIVEMLVKMHIGRLDVIPEDQLKDFSEFYTKCFNNEQLIYISKLLTFSFEFIDDNASTDSEVSSEYNDGSDESSESEASSEESQESSDCEEKPSPLAVILGNKKDHHLLNIIIKMWPILGDDIMYDRLEAIFDGNNLTGVLELFDVLYHYFAGPKALTDILDFVLRLDRCAVLTQELIDCFNAQDNPNHVLTLCVYLFDKEIMSEDHLEFIIQNPKITEEELLAATEKLLSDQVKKLEAKVYQNESNSPDRIISSSSSSSSEEEVKPNPVLMTMPGYILFLKNAQKTRAESEHRDIKPGFGNS